MANFPGSAGALPDTYVEIVTNTRAANIPGGVRLAAIIGEGLRVEKLVSSAVGGGNDGLDSTFETSTGSNGRYFILSESPLTANRTVLYKNGVPLTGLEEAIDDSSFSSLYDYRIDITNGQIELQSAALQDQGGAYYISSTLNVGTGTISSLTLEDDNAPTETWNIRCASIRRDSNGDPVDGYARFIAQGTVSGVLLDGYGNQVSWQSDGVVVSNGIVSFAINEGATYFEEGDKFTVKVKSGALSRGDSLVAHYIPTGDINDPEFFTSLDSLYAKHGEPSTTNRLSLGAQLAFANNTPGVWACQAAPAIPRRVSYTLEESASGNDAADDLSFALPLGVVPDTDTNINFFITDPVTGVESQIIPNKVEFYDATITASPTSAFHTSSTYEYSYTVILDADYEIINQADDGVLTSVTGTTATLESDTITFGILDASSTRRIKILSPNDNAGTFEVVSVNSGAVTISNAGGFTDETAVEFEVLDNTGNGARILFTDDLALGAGESLRAAVVDTRDASFYDVGWQAAYEALETIECDIVVPLPSQTISSIFITGRSHVETMGLIKNRKERMLFIGAINGLVPGNVIGTTNAAVEDLGVLEGIQGDSTAEVLAGDTEDLTDYGVQSAYGTTYRVVYFYPDQIVVQIGADKTILDGFFIAAAAAGYLSSVSNVAIPLTNKTLAGFSILKARTYRRIIEEQIANAGMTLVRSVAGGGTVVWGRTTTASGFPEEEEISIVFIRDRVAKSTRAAFKAFIGSAESPTFQGTLMARAKAVMDSFISSGLITAYRELKVIRDVVDPRQWVISCQIQPVYPVNWILVKIGVGIL